MDFEMEENLSMSDFLVFFDMGKSGAVLCPFFVLNVWNSTATEQHEDMPESLRALRIDISRK